ncbi:hypothetical protein D3C78_358860 [compost metagenome]
MQLVGGNTDFRAQAVLEAVGEAGRGVEHDRRRIDLGHELAGFTLVFADDRVGVVRAIVVDVLDGLVQAIDHTNRQDGVEVLGEPIVFAGRLGLDQRTGTLAPAQFDALFLETAGHFRQETFSHTLVDQQGFHRTANTVTVSLGVESNAQGLVQVRVLGNIDVTDAVQVLDDRHTGIAADAFDQATAAPRDDDIDKLRHADQRANRLTVGGLDHLNHGGRQAGLGKATLNAGSDGAVGVNGLGAAAQDGGVAGLQAQAGGIDGHVRARFVDDPDHPQRHAHLADLNTRRAIAHVADGADRVCQAGHLAQAGDHAVDTRWGQGQAVEQGRLQTVGTAGGQVLFVGCGKLGTRGVQCIGSSLQGAVLLRSAGAGDHPGGLASGATQTGHVVKNGLSHGFGVLAKGKSADYNCRAGIRPAAGGGW